MLNLESLVAKVENKLPAALHAAMLYGLSALAVAICTIVGMAMHSLLTPIDIAMIYLIGAVLVAVKLERGPSLVYAFLSVTAFNFFFVEPIYSFNVYDRSYWLTFIVMLVTSLVISAQASQLRLQAAISEKSKLEAESEKMRSLLLSTISHDLRTPLASITGAASSIAMDAASLPRDTIGELGRSIHQEADRLSRIVTNLLDVTSLESGTVKLNLQPYFIEEIVGSMLTHQEKALSTHDIITNADPDLPMVKADGIMIEQVLVNLLENALKYTPAGSVITISAHKKDDKVLVSIADNGVGIPSGDEKKIFDKFYTTAAYRVQKGAGLGLAICHSIIAAHGGDIWAQNKPEGGAEFSFTLCTAQFSQKDMTHDAA